MAEPVTQALDPKQYPILVVDDEQDNLDAFRFNFRKVFDIVSAGSGAEALEVLKQKDVAVIITDQRMPKMSGLELLKEAKELRPDAVGIILTAFTDVDVLIEAITLGQVYRYITKPWDAKEVRGILQYALDRFHLQRENRRMAAQLAEYTGYLNQQIHGAFDFGNIIGDSPALREVLGKVEQVAPTSSTVLLRGETGTGKEMVAHAIHINSPRENKPFVRVNCAALAPGILESELFGHEKGAFTGAITARRGRFELAEGGTLFLDEIGDMPMPMQVKLLRVLQERTFERVGSNKAIEADVRIVAATHRKLEEQIASGAFREDLYYRLNVFPIEMPPLRERIGDLPQLIDDLLRRQENQSGSRMTLTPAALRCLGRYPWPGNVRELANLIERLAILQGGGGAVEVPDLPPKYQIGAETETHEPADSHAALAEDAEGAVPPAAGRNLHLPAGGLDLKQYLSDLETQLIVSALEESNGVVAHAASLLKMRRTTLVEKIRKYGIKAADDE